MSGFLASRGLLATTWFVILGGLVGVLTLVLVQPPPPPPLGEPVVVALNLPQPPEGESDEDDGGPEVMPPPAAASPGGAGSGPSSGPSSGPGGEPAAAVAANETPPQASHDTPAPGTPAAETAPAQVPATATVALPIPTPIPTPGAAPEPASEPAQEAAQAETAAAPAGHDAPAVAAPETMEKPPEPAAPPPAAVTLALPEAKPESKPAAPPPGAQAGHGPAPVAAVDQHAAEAGAPAQEQVAAIPVIPPAPEELPYWERYRQPFNMEDKRPRIAVVMSGLGLSDSATEAAINKLPPAVTLSFSPYARGLERWIALARARGHEVMLDLPMEPATFPNEDPGPQGLLVNLSAEDNLDRLDWVLSRGSAYVGLAGAMGSRFTASRRAMKPILDDVKQRGLIFLDRRTTEHSVVPEIALEIGLPRAINNRSVDERQASRVAIDARLAQIERIALAEGFAVAMAQPYPVTLDRLAEWATELIGRGFVIAPISALADQQKTP